ncbi:GCN5-related N-acetyltransferase [Caballeronia sordidicola]|uniref:GCN5-related N-acetyltransferase n=2 Tax=Burkholderiales TaxID=80840 RepID=A0A242M377_CABSO|nr:GCN5-related N-acetyltransferase [Caballeronia sordidicola]
MIGKRRTIEGLASPVGKSTAAFDASQVHRSASIEGSSMEHIEFRSARLADISAIVAMLADDPLGSQREIVGTPLDGRYVAAFEAIDSDANQHLMVVTGNDEVIGTLQLTFIPGIARMGAWRGQIEAVRIAAHRRDSGLGQKMFEWAIAQCRARGCNLVQLTTDKTRADAHRFYDKLGFIASHEGYKLAL